MRVIVLAGFTGTGKTELLARLAAGGEQTIDLEALAHHRGSVFGTTRHAQPSHTEFGARLEAACRAADPARVLWLEDTAPFIGSVGVPPLVLRAIECAPFVQVTSDLARRCTRLLATYGDTPLVELLTAVERIAPRLGAGRATTVRAALANGHTMDAVRVLLEYYDAGYDRRVVRLKRRMLARVDSDVSPEWLVTISNRWSRSIPAAR